ncbi:MAG: enoyl-CoA hydratase-related protein [Thermaerobacter sp.]|nr:enoyl-CoA hydratase-related protein [Thermaerobacter sp.]
MTATVSWEIEGQTGWIWINRPEKRNAMTDAMWQKLAGLVDEAPRMGARAVVISGRGGSFVAGADILEFESTKNTPSAAQASFASVDNACRAVQDLPIPVIAAIDGFAVGAGLELAAACDFRLASGNARLGITASKLGITPGRAHIARLWEVVGTARTLDLLMTGRLITAHEAYAMGLLYQIAEDGNDLREAAGALARLLAERAPLTLSWTKSTVRRLVTESLLDRIGDDAGDATVCFATSDFREAVQAFKEKRPPIFGSRAD